MNELPDKLSVWASHYCLPPLDLRQLRLFPAEEPSGWYLEMLKPSPEVHATNHQIYVWDELDEIRTLALGNANDADAIFDLMKTKYHLSTPTVESTPQMVFAYLSGLECDARDEDGVRYDPREQLIKWTDSIPFRYEADTYQYEPELMAQLKCPIELYDQKKLDSRIDILFPDKLLSGLDLAYFDTVGREVEITVEKKTTVKIQFDQIALDKIFRNREFKSTRRLIFEGINVELEQLGQFKGCCRI